MAAPRAPARAAAATAGAAALDGAGGRPCLAFERRALARGGSFVFHSTLREISLDQRQHRRRIPFGGAFELAVQRSLGIDEKARRQPANAKRLLCARGGIEVNRHRLEIELGEE